MAWAAALAVLAALCVAPRGDGRPAPSGAIVWAEPGALADVRGAVERAGGEVTAELRALDLVTVRLPVGAWHRIAALPGVRAVTVDRALRPRHAVDGFDPSTDANAMHRIVQAIGAREYYDRGFTGRGVDVALVDSGVVPVAGLDAPGKLVHGPDLSFESQAAELRHLDTYGHGTHLAGLIAGRDNGVGVPSVRDHHEFHGVAPGARLVSLKVADAHGGADVSQVLAAVDWIIQHRRSHGLDIRVLTLAFGTDAVQDHRLDPLSHAVETAWHAGIVVVVAAGNGGSAAGRLSNPAVNPFVLAVGAQDTRGTQGRADDVIPPFSSHGDGARNPDLVAPGTSVVGLLAPGSAVDRGYPQARVAERYLRGSGTSQAAAIVAGAAALVIEQHPEITPDELKRLLTETAEPLPAADPRGQGAGAIDLGAALTRRPQTGHRQRWEQATGHGSLDAARGSMRLRHDDEVLDGERDIFGMPFDTGVWAPLSRSHSAWSGGWWNDSAWTGTGWVSPWRWEAVPWMRSSWSRSSWSADSWSRSSWSRSSWSTTQWDSYATTCAGPPACAPQSPDHVQRVRWSGGGWG